MAYDEFSMFAHNAAEVGLTFVAPSVTRESVAVGSTQQLSFLRWGTAAPELVLLHGGAQNAHTWDTVNLAHQRPTVAFDLPGHGHSDHRPDHDYWPHENAAAIEVAMRALEVRPSLVVGMSLGGLTAIALAARAADLVPALVLVDVTPGVDHEKASSIAQFINGPEYFESFDEILERTVLFNPTRSESSLRRGILHNAVEDADGRWRWRYDLPRAGSGAGDDGALIPGLDALWDAIETYPGPITLARGAKSPVVADADVEELLRRRPDATVAVFANSGHSIQGDEPLALSDLLQSKL